MVIYIEERDRPSTVGRRGTRKGTGKDTYRDTGLKERISVQCDLIPGESTGVN